MTREEFAAMSLRAVGVNFRRRNVRCVSGPGDRQHKRIKTLRRCTIRRWVGFARIALSDEKWARRDGNFDNYVSWLVS